MSTTAAETNDLMEKLGALKESSPMLPIGAAEGNSGSVGPTTSIEERALSLLGSGIAAESVAAALGVTAARISQLLSDEGFALKVATRRYEHLQKHNKRDEGYDAIEDKLIEKLTKSLSFMVKPETILKAISVINSAKRRGTSSPEQASANQKIVTLVLPTQIVQTFVTNIDNQVTKAGEQELLTLPSGQLLQNMENAQERRVIEYKETEDDPSTGKEP